MSVTSTSSSCASSNVRSSTSSGSVYRPANISRYALATLFGVSCRPSRSGSSPHASSSSRTAFSARSWSNTDPPVYSGPRLRWDPLTVTTTSGRRADPQPQDPSAPTIPFGTVATCRPILWTVLLGRRLRLVPRRPPRLVVALRRGRRGPPGRGTVVRRAGVAARLVARVRLAVRTARVRTRLRQPVRTGAVAARRFRLRWRRPTRQLATAGGGAHRGRRLLLDRRPRLAAFLGQLARGLDRRLVRRGTTAELVERGDPRPLLDAGEDPLQVLALQRLLLQQLDHEAVEDVAVGVEHVPRLGVRRLDELAHLLVDLVRDLQRVVRRVAHRPAQERVALVLAVLDRAELGRHAVLGDHRLRDLGGLLDVRRGTRRGLVEHQLLRGAAAEREHQACDHLRPGHELLVVLGDD